MGKMFYRDENGVVRINFRSLAVDLGNLYSYGGAYPKSAIRDGDWEFITIGIERKAIDEGITLTPDTLVGPYFTYGYPDVVVPYKDFKKTYKFLFLDLLIAYAQGLADGWENAKLEYEWRRSHEKIR